VGSYFNNQYKIISNDLLYSNYTALNTFLKTENLEGLSEKIDYLNNLKPQENYYSKNFGDTYFTMENAMKIGTIRDFIDDIAESENQKNILLTSLIYATDKVANTVGHYDAFRKKMDTTKPLKLLMPKIETNLNQFNQVFNQDANQLISKIESDILYIDPPYNSRQYSDAYHLLENLTHNNKPQVFGKAKKMDRQKIKSNYCTKQAVSSFYDLISKAKTRYILISYNNTGEKKDGRSNARISDQEIIEILEQEAKLKFSRKNIKLFLLEGARQKVIQKGFFSVKLQTNRKLQIKFFNMLKPWSITTTVRNPERMRSFLKVLKELEGQEWTKENQEKYQILLIQNRLYGYGNQQFYNSLPQNKIDLLEDLNTQISFKDASDIFKMKNYEDPAMRGRQSVNPLKKFGFVLFEEKILKISQLGHYFLSDDYDLGEVFFRMFLKWQLPNPATSDYKKEQGVDIKPFIGTLHLINKVNQLEEKAERKAKGLSKRRV
jgi:adenine-specific DNA-methyltransferase